MFPISTKVKYKIHHILLKKVTLQLEFLGSKKRFLQMWRVKTFFQWSNRISGIGRVKPKNNSGSFCSITISLSEINRTCIFFMKLKKTQPVLVIRLIILCQRLVARAWRSGSAVSPVISIILIKALWASDA